MAWVLPTKPADREVFTRNPDRQIEGDSRDAELACREGRAPNRSPASARVCDAGAVLCPQLMSLAERYYC